MNNKFYITIDTEPDCDIKWKRSAPLAFTSITVGIPQFYRPIWNKYNIQPIYFVCAEVVRDDECCKILKKEIEAGAIIGTHLHSEYIEPNITGRAGMPSLEYPCYAHSSEIEYQKIKNLTELIKNKLGVDPEWYRAARFGSDLDTIKSLKKLGYKYDSSVTPHINWTKQGGPNHTKGPEQPYWIAQENYYKSAKKEDSIGVEEIPVTISGKRGNIFSSFLSDNWLFYKWLRPTHMTIYEQKKLIDSFYEKYSSPTFVMMFHSMEIMVNKTPYVRNKWMQKKFLERLEEIIKYVHIKNNIK